MIQQEQTVKQWLEQVAGTDTSTEQDSDRMQYLLRRIGFPRTVVVMGVVYVEGHGTVDYPPVSIHFVAEVLLKAESLWEAAKERMR